MMPNKIKYATAIPKKLDAPSGLCPSQTGRKENIWHRNRCNRHLPEKKIHCYRTKVHATVHLFLTFFAIRIMIDDFGRRNSFDHTYHPTWDKETRSLATMFRRLPFKQDRNRQAGDIQLAGIINDAFGSRNQLRHTVHFLKWAFISSR